MLLVSTSLHMGCYPVSHNNEIVSHYNEIVSHNNLWRKQASIGQGPERWMSHFFSRIMTHVWEASHSKGGKPQWREVVDFISIETSIVVPKRTWTHEGKKSSLNKVKMTILSDYCPRALKEKSSWYLKCFTI